MALIAWVCAGTSSAYVLVSGVPFTLAGAAEKVQ